MEHGTLSWYSMSAMEHGTLSWYSMSAMEHGTLSWYSMSAMEHGTLPGFQKQQRNIFCGGAISHMNYVGRCKCEGSSISHRITY